MDLVITLLVEVRFTLYIKASHKTESVLHPMILHHPLTLSCLNLTTVCFSGRLVVVSCLNQKRCLVSTGFFWFFFFKIQVNFNYGHIQFGDKDILETKPGETALGRKLAKQFLA